MAKKSYLITGRLIESNCLPEDIAFYEEKRAKGYTDTAYIREMTTIARKYADGTLLRDEISRIIDEKLPQVLLKFIQAHPVSYQPIHTVHPVQNMQAITADPPGSVHQNQSEMAAAKEETEISPTPKILSVPTTNINPETHYEFSEEDKANFLADLMP